MKSTRPVVVITFSDGIEGAHLQLLKDEKTALENVLWDLHAKEVIEIYKEESMSRQELVDLLPRFGRNRIVLFHYAGHAGSEGIFTEGGAARAEGVAGLLGLEKSLQLVVLNGCSTMEQVKGLKAKGVKAIIATSSPIGDEAAKGFATTFYKQLAIGQPLREAFNYAIAATQTAKAIDSHIQPMRAASFVDADEVDDIPWDLYYDEAHPEILDWTFPSPADPKPRIDPSIYKTPEELQVLSYPEKKKHLLKVLENDLNRIIPDLDALLSSDSEHRDPLRLLNVQLNDYFRNLHSGAVTGAALESEKKRIKLEIGQLVSLLETKDFAPKVDRPAREESIQAPAVERMNTGGIWRKISPEMQVNVPAKCQVRIAADKDQLKQERASSDIEIRIDTIRTSNKMAVDLIEPPAEGGPYFEIDFIGSKLQQVDEREPTEWTFYVTPLQLGKYQLVLHVTIAGENGDENLVKVIPLEETIEVVDYQPEALGVYEKAVLLRYLPYGGLLPLELGPGPEQAPVERLPEPTPTLEPPPPPPPAEPAVATPTKATTGLGIGKIMAGLVSLAVLAGLAWWMMQDGDTVAPVADAGTAEQEAPAVTDPQTDDQTTAITPVESAAALAETEENEPNDDADPSAGTEGEKATSSRSAGQFRAYDRQYTVAVGEPLTIQYSDLMEGDFLANYYTFRITQNEYEKLVTFERSRNSVVIRSSRKGLSRLRFEICRTPGDCSTGDISINATGNAPAPVEAPAETQPTPAAPPPVPAYRYSMAMGDTLFIPYTELTSGGPITSEQFEFPSGTNGNILSLYPYSESLLVYPFETGSETFRFRACRTPDDCALGDLVIKVTPR